MPDLFAFHAPDPLAPRLAKKHIGNTSPGIRGAIAVSAELALSDIQALEFPLEQSLDSVAP
jgi:hypothetical protein